MVTFETLNETMPELGVSNLLREWPHGTIPRFVKTHKKYWPLVFDSNRSVLLVRDPRDVMVSYYEYKKGKGEIDEDVEFGEFIRRPKVGLEGWCKHYESWKSESTVRVFYEDMKENDVGEFSRMLKALNISIQHDVVKEAARRSRFGEIQKIEKKFGTGKKGSNFKSGKKFTRKGKTGEWEKYFCSNDRYYYESTINKYSINVYRS